MRKIENDQNGNTRIAFGATLLSIAEKPLELNNAKKTLYHPANIEFVDAHGVVQKTTCMIFAKNVAKGMEVGKDYHAVATLLPAGPIITLAPFAPNADRPTQDMFAIEVADETSAKVNVLTGEIAS